jgi:hypothetical protein
MAKRGPTDSDHSTPPAEGDYEVVNAAGERKTASLPKRMLAGARDLVSMTDEQPTWKPGELDPVLCPEGGTTLQCSLPKGHSGPHDYRPRHDSDDATLVVGNGDVAVPDQPPSNLLATYRRQHAANTAAAVDEVARKVGQLVGLDRRARHYAYDVQHLIGIHALCAKAIDQLADHDLVNHALIREVAAEVAGWQQDREVGS